MAKMLLAACLLLGSAALAGAQCVPAECDDGDPCNGAETCENDVCTSGTPAEDGTACDDDDPCTLGDTCQEGACQSGAPRDCSAEDGQCTQGDCNPETGVCDAQPINVGEPCDDGKFCTQGESCNNAGACSGGTPRDCSAFDGACTTGVCNETTGACEPQPANDGQTCNDGQFCTVNDQCDNGMCAGVARDCSHLDGPCTDGVCNPAAGACEPQPANQGQSCDDGLFCNGMDTCNNAGQCTHAGDPCAGQGECRDACNEATDSCLAAANTPCTEDGNACTFDRCNGMGTCEHPPRPNGTACDDGLFCTATDACSAGTCVGTGDPCAGGAECNATCNEAGDNCFAPSTVPCTDDGNVCTDDRCNGMGACGHPPNTAPCDDGLFCNGADVCSGGECTHAGDPCAAGPECADTCDEAAKGCITPAGTPCTDDGIECTTDLCLNGTCDHAPLNSRCDQGECVLGTCAPGAPGADKRGCVATPVAEGEQCTDDGFACTDDTCSGGVCLHVPISSRCVPPQECTSAVCAPGQPNADVAGCLPGPALGEGQQCAEDGEPCTDDLCRASDCAHDPVPDTATCEPVTRAFRQALALEALARGLMASVADAFAGAAGGGQALATPEGMLARLGTVTLSLEEVSRTLSGKSPLPPDAGGRVRGVPKTIAQLRAEAALGQLAKKPADVRAFLRLTAGAKRREELSRDSARALRSSGRLVLERMRKLRRELRRLRRVSQTFVP